MNRLLVIAWKELIQLRRDRLTLGMMVGIPVIQLLLFGYAINTDVRHMPTVVYDQDHTAESRDFAERMRATGYYDLEGEVQSYDEVSHALRSSRARVALVVPAGYATDLARGRTAQLQLVVDGTDPQTVGSALNTAASLAASRSAELRFATLARRGAPDTPEAIHLEPATWYNPEQRTAVFVVPGLVGMILTMTMVMLTSMAVVRERERGTMEQLIVSPVRRIELIVGKILPFVIIGYVQITLILLLGHFVFDVPIHGSLPLLYGMSAVFIFACLALGLFFSTLAKSQQQAMQMSFFYMLPSILLSGFVFPFEGMPKPAQWIAQALPLTHFLRIVRGITLRGGGFSDVKAELVWLAVILVILVAAASLRFRKKLG